MPPKTSEKRDHARQVVRIAPRSSVALAAIQFPCNHGLTFAGTMRRMNDRAALADRQRLLYGLTSGSRKLRTPQRGSRPFAAQLGIIRISLVTDTINES